jgi:non-ribosomal peptide synthetase component F
MVGAVYCPLSPHDPEQRLQTLIQETSSRLVLMHSMTRETVKNCGGAVNIDTVLEIDWLLDAADIDRLSSVGVTPESIAYVIFTSGSTGIPKAVRNELCASIS